MLEIFGIYLSLNSVEEWPEYFEETFPVWGVVFQDMIIKNSSEDPETLIKVKKVAIDIVRTLCFRHGEYFPKEYTIPYFESIWKLLPLLPSMRDYNKIV
jgi:Cse1